MDAKELINASKRIIEVGTKISKVGYFNEAAEFLRTYSGEKSEFYRNLISYKAYLDYDYGNVTDTITSILEAFVRYVESGLLHGISVVRKIQIDIVSDLVDQANGLLNERDIHPAAPTVVVGAALEEFLRNWIEEKNFNIGDKKPCIDTYAKILREENLIDKQDIKDITSWAGMRNDAAHGEWEKVKDKEKISLMLQGVNLFMRKYMERSE